MSEQGKKRDAMLSTEALSIAACIARENDCRFQLALAHSPIAVFEQDLDLRYTWIFNPKLGYRADAVIGKTDAEIMDPACAPRLTEIKRKVIETGRPTRQEVVAAAPGAPLEYYDLSVEPRRDGAGRIIGVICSASDITLRKQGERALLESEEFNRAIIENSPDCVKVLDPTGRLLTMNDPGLCLMEIDNFEAVRGKPWWTLWPESSRQRIENAVAAASAGTSSRFQEFAPTAKGTPKWWDVIVTPIRDAERGVPRLLCVSRDITESKRTEEALREADRRKDEFLATLAHELRNPLAPVRNGLYVLRRSRAMDAAAEHVQEMMERQVNHLVRLVDDLMDVSRISCGKINLKKERVDLGAVVHQAVEMTRELVEANRLELKLMLPTEPQTLDADPARLAQMFGNLLDNAAKYTHPGGRVEISAERLDGEAIVTVADTGVGIPPEMLPLVFDRFVQIDGTLARARGGLGIGLALVRDIVRLHGGDVEAHSDGEGLGSRFIVRLPLSIAAARETTVSAAREAPSSRRVLLIDDNLDVADSLALLLGILGATVQVANDGAHGLEALIDLKPDLVLLDLSMPGMDGYETARRIRELPEGKNTTLIALTGWGGDEIRKRTEESGFDRHLIKPVEIEELEKILEGSHDRDHAER